MSSALARPLKSPEIAVKRNPLARLIIYHPTLKRMSLFSLFTSAQFRALINLLLSLILTIKLRKNR